MYTIKIVYYERGNQHGVSDKKGDIEPLVVPYIVVYKLAEEFEYYKKRMSKSKFIDWVDNNLYGSRLLTQNSEQQCINSESLADFDEESTIELAHFVIKDGKGKYHVLDILDADIFIMEDGKTIDTIRTSHN